MIDFKKDIEEFGNKDLKEAVILAVMNNTPMKDIQERFHTTRANTSLIKTKFLDFVYRNHKSDFDEFFEIEKNKTMSLNFFANKYKNIAKEVISKIYKSNNIDAIVADSVISKKFYNEVSKYIKNVDRFPIYLNKMAKDLKCTINNIDDVLNYYSTTNTIYFDRDFIYAFQIGAYKLVDAIAEFMSADLPELYEKVKQIVKPLPKVMSNYEKFVTLINARLISKKILHDGLNNFFRIGKGKESIVTKKKAMQMFDLDEQKLEDIVKACYEIANNMECTVDTEFLLEKIEEGGVPKLTKKINPYLLKSILVQSDVFEQGRKFNVAIKERGCKFKKIDEMVETVFEKTGKTTMTIKEIEDALRENGRYVTYNNLYNVLKKNFEYVSPEPVPTFSSKRIGLEK